MVDRKRAALEYHEMGRPGKIAVVPTKPVGTQWDLSLAYTPGVAEPCRVIAEDPDAAFRYTDHRPGAARDGPADPRAPARQRSGGRGDLTAIAVVDGQRVSRALGSKGGKPRRSWR